MIMRILTIPSSLPNKVYHFILYSMYSNVKDRQVNTFFRVISPVQLLPLTFLVWPSFVCVDYF